MNVTSYIINISNSDDNIIQEITGGASTSIIKSNIRDVQNLVTKTTESECINESETCCSNTIKCLMSKFIQDTDGEINKDNNIIDYIENKLQCDSESCVLNNKDFQSFVIKETGSIDIINKELNTSFKTKGPRDNTNLLSNYNIDETLLRWARKFKHFWPCPFSMIDFKEVYNTFGTIDLAKIMTNKISYTDPIYGSISGPFKTFGCVLNTDISSGRGKHWVCMFVDCRSDIWSIEYFNSSGNPPNYDTIDWMETQRSNLLQIHKKVDTIMVTNIVHQKSNTECGMYVLYYIRSRLDNVPYSYFVSQRIDDAKVINFRKHVFRKH